MKLQKQSSRKRGDPNYKRYVKWTIILPADKVKELGWEEGIELVEEIKENSLKIKKRKTAKK